MAYTRMLSQDVSDTIVMDATNGVDTSVCRAISFSATSAAVVAASSGFTYEHSDNRSSWTAVDPMYLYSPFDAVLAAANPKTQYMDYIPQKRYVRVTPATGVNALLRGPRHFENELLIPR